MASPEGPLAAGPGPVDLQNLLPEFARGQLISAVAPTIRECHLDREMTKVRVECWAKSIEHEIWLSRLQGPTPAPPEAPADIPALDAADLGTLAF